MPAEKNSQQMRVSFALLCGLAVCASVMYLTADHDEYIHEGVGDKVQSMDVLKAEEIYSETPHGRMKLMDYFNNVETSIATEVANRKHDIMSVRAQMAKDFAFNMGARRKLNRDMLHKMAQNARIARNHLNRNMRRTQERFAKQAHLANRRYRALKRSDRRTQALIKHDKREAARNLKLAVQGWQKSTAAWASKTNARINKMNKHVAANAAQIKENAKKARKDLEMMTSKWDNKVHTFRTESKNARNKLSAQFAAQSKATRAWANNQIKTLMASTAAQFNDVETKMAKNRQEVDLALRHATARFGATLAAQKALENKRYAESQVNILALKKETALKVNAASTQYKVALLSLGSTVSEQVAKVNRRIDHTADTARSDAAEQAKKNAAVNAEMNRMIKLGNQRYAKHVKHDAHLQKVINDNQSAINRKLKKMAATFNAALGKVRKQLKKDRKHAEDRLAKETQKVYDQLKKQQDAQEKKNAEMKAATRRMHLDQMDKIRQAKKDFIKKIHHLAKVVKKNDKKADKKIKDLAGVVKANAAKSLKGRQVLYDLEESNKKELKKSIAEAIAKGEKRAKQVLANGKKMDAKTRFKINNKLNAEITKLREETNASVEALALQSKEARAEMKKEMLYAIRSAAEVAKADLTIAIKDGAKKMMLFMKKSAQHHTKSALERKALKEEIESNKKQVARMIKDAVARDAKAQTALGQETAAAIKKTNTKVDAYAAQMKKITKKSRAMINAQTTSVMGKIRKQQKRLKKALKKFKSKDKQRQKLALKFLKTSLDSAKKKSDRKFGKAYIKLADDRAHADKALSSTVVNLNDALAAQAALEDVRFKKTVKNIAAARKAARDQVEDMRKAFTSSLITTTALAKNVETKLADNIAVVSGEVISMKALQARVNRRVSAEKIRIEKLSNKHFAESKRARGKLKAIMNQNKVIAWMEMKQLAKDTNAKIDKARAHNAHNRREVAKDLSEATEKFYTELAEQQKADQDRTKKLNGATQKAMVKTGNQLKIAKQYFSAKITQLSDTVSANAKTAENAMTRLTGVVYDINKAAAKDRGLIKNAVKVMEADLNKALARAISIGEAKAKAVQQRLAEHTKNTKRYLQVELSESTEAAADKVFRMVEQRRGKIADNYLSLKAYAIAASDDVEDYVGKGKGRALSSVGDLLDTIGQMGAVRAPARKGLGMGGSVVPAIFSGKNIKVSSAVSVVNGLVDEYTKAALQVRNRWPMGLGKYLMDKLQRSMYVKGVLQVGKKPGTSGDHVYVNGHAIGLSNKLEDLAKLGVKLTTYESVLAKLTAKISLVKAPSKPKAFFAKPPEYQGH
jgi:hypothetical protein